METYKPFLMTHCGEKSGLVPLDRVIIAPSEDSALSIAAELTDYPRGILAVQEYNEWRRQSKARVMDFREGLHRA